MGMKIAEPIQTLEYLKNCGVFPFSTVEEVLYTEASIDVAIDTMSKYQKITEIVAHYRENVRDKVTNENMEKILKVVEDGKID